MSSMIRTSISFSKQKVNVIVNNVIVNNVIVFELNIIFISFKIIKYRIQNLILFVAMVVLDDV